MNTISYSKARNELANTMEKVCTDHAPVIITRQKADPVVMLSLEDFHSLEETTFLLRSPKNAARLMEAIEEIEKGEAKEKDLLE
jgi:antitoxin YefM